LSFTAIQQQQQQQLHPFSFSAIITASKSNALSASHSDNLFSKTRLLQPLTFASATTLPSRRCFSSSKSDSNDKKEADIKKNDALSETDVTSQTDSHGSSSTDKLPFLSGIPNAPARTAGELAKIRQNFANYEETIKRVVSSRNGAWNTSDLLSVYGIVALIILIGTAPFVIR
jgi:hypothetical protein